MIEKKYGRRAAEHILGPLMAEDEVLGMLDDALRVDDAGVWAGDEGPWLWLPSMELDTREIDLSATPGLPFPFDALDLAAFMVGGVGGWIREFYGPVGDGPDADRLALMHQHANVARESLAAAYMVLRDAVNVVGAEPDSNTPEWIEWRRAMVRKLYEMRQDSPSASASAPAVAVPEPVASAPTSSASPAHSDDLILELRKHREAIERAAREADQRHTHERVHAGFARIRAATEAGIKAVHATQKPNASPATTHGPVAPPVEAPQVASWTFIPSKRETGYGADLNALLQRRHKSGKPIPTAAEVIDIWKANPPRIFHVVGGNLEYCPESGWRWKEVKEKSLNEAIKKRTSA